MKYWRATFELMRPTNVQVLRALVAKKQWQASNWLFKMELKVKKKYIYIYFSHYGEEDRSLSLTDVNGYVIIRNLLWRMPSSGLWRRVDVLWTDVSEQLQPPAQAGSSLADFYLLKIEAIRSSETSVHTISTRLHIQEDGILHGHRRGKPKSYIQIY
jgi:hypothetical protein